MSRWTLSLRTLLLALGGLVLAASGARADTWPLDAASGDVSSGAVTRAAIPAWHRPWPCCVKLEVEVYARAGKASGYLQTPRGGQPGTSSVRRPTVGELDAEGAGEIGFRIRALYRRSELFLEAGGLSLAGCNVLGEDLVSQGSLFPAGSSVDSSSGLGIWRLGYRYRFDVRTGRRSGLEIRPGAGLTGLWVDYRLDGSNYAVADRSYFHVAPHVDLALAWRPCVTSRWWLSGSVGQTLTFVMPETNQMNLFDANLRVNFDFAKKWTAYLETGYRTIDWHDAQPMENHIHVKYGPFVGLGLSFQF